MTGMNAPRPKRKNNPGLLRPVLWILSAVLAVQLCRSLPAPEFMADGIGGLFENPGFAEGVLRASGVGGGETVRPEAAGLLALQSSNIRSLWAEWKANNDPGLDPPPEEPLILSSIEPPENPPHSGLIEPPEELFAPPSETPSAAPSGETPPSETPPSETPVPSMPPYDVDPAAAWINGPYVMPSADDPKAKRLIEVTLMPTDSGYNNNGVVYLKNKVTDTQDIDALLKRELKTTQTDSSEPQILIVFTHTTESFFPDERDFYVPSDIQRTEDTRFNVVRLGERLAENLRALGLNVIVDTTVCDLPSFSGAYSKALKVIEAQLKAHPSIQMVIDVHRDSLQSENGTAYKVVSKTSQGKAAQMMLVVGSDLNGLTHPNWKDNLAMALNLQEQIVSAYPTLMRPANLRKERFNQHAAPNSMILEVGTAWNTLQEALLSIDLFSQTAGPFLAAQFVK